jgi:hypothetical protein
MNDPKNFFTFPSELKSSTLILRIAYIIEEQTKKLKNLNQQLKIDHYITLNQLIKLIEEDLTLSKIDKDIKSIEKAINEMLDTKNNGKEKAGYIIPQFNFDGKSFSCELKFIGCSKGSQSPTLPFRNLAIDNLRNHLENFYNTEQFSKSNYYSNPSNYLYESSETVDKFIYNGLSLDRPIYKALEKAFLPFKPFDLPDFQEDFENYLNQSTFTIRLASNYFIKKYTLNIDELGNSTNEPEEYFHFFNIFKELEKNSKELLVSLTKLKMDVSASYLIQYFKTFSEPISNDVMKEVERCSKLVEIIKKIPTNEKLDRDFLFSLKNSTGILDTLIGVIPKIHKSFEDQKAEAKLNGYLKKVTTHNQKTKTLFKQNPSKPMENLNPNENDPNFINLFQDTLFNKFNYMEITPEFGSPFYYILSPSAALYVVHNLCKLSLTNEIFRDEFKVAKEIYEKYQKQNNPFLNELIPLNEIESLKNDLNDMENKIEKIEVVKSAQKTFNIHIFALVNVIVIIISILIYMNTEEFIFLLTAIPIGLILGYLAGGFLFKNKPKRK